jgi:hypothetical protein
MRLYAWRGRRRGRRSKRRRKRKRRRRRRDVTPSLDEPHWLLPPSDSGKSRNWREGDRGGHRLYF